MGRRYFTPDGRRILGFFTDKEGRRRPITRRRGRGRAKRGKVKGRPAYYVVRDSFGRFKDWSYIPRSLKVDARTEAKYHPKEPGYGHKGDYRKYRGKVVPPAKRKRIPGFPEEDVEKAREAFRKRSARSRAVDLSKLAPTAPSVEDWMKRPNRLDIPGVDTPSGKREKPKETQPKKAEKPKPPKKVEKPKPPKKAEKPKPPEKPKTEKPKQAKLAKAPEKPKPKGRRLPTRPEIIQKAVELWMEEHGYHFLDIRAPTPEYSELKEGGYIERAQRELMKSEKRRITETEEREKARYIQALKEELESLGYEVIPVGAA